ncbi:glycosyltransferase family 39 protein [Candidatus Daviesbacteria bacterium]|nr:glycosyltransferase family 39 protein [Candidatus Daviesbacteria bacterium]
MSKTIKDIVLLSLITTIITFLIWLPHFLALPNFYGLDFSSGFSNIYKNYDGLEYITIAKSFYNPDLIASIPQSLSANYYAAHFPLYSIFILFFGPIFGMLKSMLFVSLIFTIFSAIAFYFLVRDFQLSTKPLWLSIIFLLLPARWIIVHSIGSSEPTFIFFVITSIYFFMKFESQKKSKYILLSSIFGLFAQLTRPPGILLFLSLLLYIHWKYFLPLSLSKFKQNFKAHLSYYPLILIPVGLLGVFYIFNLNYNDFWAYFHSGDNIHLTFPPFQVFNKSQYWVGEIWLEDIIFVFLLGILGGLTLIKQKLYPLAFFVLTYLVATSLVTHRDVSRYALPIFPFVLIAFEKVLTTKEFKIVLAVLLLALYLYSQNFLIHNVAPIANLNPYN